MSMSHQPHKGFHAAGFASVYFAGTPQWPLTSRAIGFVAPATAPMRVIAYTPWVFVAALCFGVPMLVAILTGGHLVGRQQITFIGSYLAWHGILYHAPDNLIGCYLNELTVSHPGITG
jgi:hypothetical protein